MRERKKISYKKKSKETQEDVVSEWGRPIGIKKYLKERDWIKIYEDTDTLRWKDRCKELKQK